MQIDRITLTPKGKNIIRMLPLLERPRTSYELCQMLGLKIGQVGSALRSLRMVGLICVTVRVKLRKQVRVYVLNHKKHLLDQYEVDGNKQPTMKRRGTRQVMGVWI